MERKTNRLPIFTERFRELQGEMSITDFAGYLGISRQNIGFYYNGNRLPDAVTIVKISKKCGVSADWLLGLSDVKTTDADIKQLCNATGLSESPAKLLSFFGENKKTSEEALILLNEILGPPILQYRQYAWRTAWASAQTDRKEDTVPLAGAGEGSGAVQEWKRDRDEKLVKEALKPYGTAGGTIELSSGEASMLFRERARRAIERAVDNSLAAYTAEVKEYISQNGSELREEASEQTEEE